MPSPKLFSIIAAVVVFFGLTVYISLISGYFLSKYNNSTNTLRDVTDSFGLTDHELMNGVESIYIIPGGGSSNKGAYPEWTQRRVTTAFDYYLDSGDSQQNKTLFVSLSAGSLNAPNSQLSPPNDPRIVFECQHVMNHLKRLGVRKEIIFGDTFSWDTAHLGGKSNSIAVGIDRNCSVSRCQGTSEANRPLSAQSLGAACIY